MPPTCPSDSRLKRKSCHSGDEKEEKLILVKDTHLLQCKVIITVFIEHDQEFGLGWVHKGKMHVTCET
jgi:hypothetical protein